MDPITAILMGAGALGTVGSATASILGDQKLQKRNKAQLQDLTAREAQGNLGLGGDEKQYLQNQLMTPVQQAASAARKRAEQIMAATGSSSGAQLTQLRQQQAQQTGAAQQNAALQIAGMDLAAQQAQKQEIEQRLAMQAALRQRDYDIGFGAAKDVMGPIGQGMGQPPARQLFNTQFTPQEQSQVADYAQRNPEAFRKLLEQMGLLNGSTGGTMAGLQGADAAQLALAAGAV